MRFFTHSLSSSQVVIASPNTFHDFGTTWSGGGQNALEFHERLLIEHDVVEITAVIPAAFRQY